MRALTGLSVPQFEMLEREFSEEYKKWQEEIYQDGLSKGIRQRRPGGGAKGKQSLRLRINSFFSWFI